jgi:ABC-type multidrug transport system ATPase subunit
MRKYKFLMYANRPGYHPTDSIDPQDPLSALDAHVGKAVFENVLRSNLAGKTRILVTHALHFLPQVDYILTIVDGRVAESGSYSELMTNDGEFSKFVTEFGSNDEATKQDGEGAETDVIDEVKTKARQNATSNGGIMQVGCCGLRGTRSID